MKYVWTAEIWKYRNPGIAQEKLTFVSNIDTVGDVTFTETLVKEHPPLISGTYTI